MNEHLFEHLDGESAAGLRVIQTARSEKAINRAADQGFRPLVRRVQPDPEIRSKFSVWQEQVTGKITVLGDYRSQPPAGGDWRLLIDWSFYYPHRFPAPFAAYLIPPDLAPGTRVYVEDLIEDFVGSTWNQGDSYRLKGCPAVWTGTDFEFEAGPSESVSVIMG